MVRFIKKRQNIIFPFLDIALNVVNYFFQLYLSWNLLPQQYGTINSLLSFSAILFVLGISFQTLTAKKVSSGHYSADTFKSIYLSTLYFLLPILLGTLILAKPIVRFLRSDYVSLLFLIVIFAFNLYLSIFRGIFQGNHQYLHLNISFYIETFVKLIAIFWLFSYRKNVHIALISILLGMVFSFFYGFLTNSKMKKFISVDHSIKTSVRQIFNQSISIYIANFFIYFFTSIDMLIINYFLPQVSGIYAVIQKYSQLILATSFSIITVFIPTFSANYNDKIKLRSIVKKAFLLFALLSLIALLGYYFILPYTVSIFFSTKYEEAANYLFFSCIAYIFLVSCFLAINVFIVLEKKRYLLYLLITSVFMLLLFLLHHESILSIIFIQILCYLLMFIFLIARLTKELKE
ncbi:oligosaccharide flippase family protein [Clostridium manihotivorum]